MRQAIIEDRQPNIDDEGVSAEHHPSSPKNEAIYNIRRVKVISEQTQDQSQDCYREKYVAFIDMLGFGQRVKDSADNYDDRREIISAINELRKSVSNIPANGVFVTYFSDCVVISSASDPDSLLTLFRAVSYIASNLIQRGVMIRGGISHGGIYHDDDLCFGPAMVRAYEIESKEAIYPCVMLDLSVYENATKYGINSNWIISDGALNRQHYLHHLKEIADLLSANEYITPDTSTHPVARLSRHTIADALNNKSIGIKKKGSWLKNYWDNHVISDPKIGFVDNVADATKPNLVPTSSVLLSIEEYKKLERRNR